MFDQFLPNKTKRNAFEAALRKYDNGTVDNPNLLRSNAEKQLCFYSMWAACSNKANDNCMRCAVGHPELLVQCTTSDFAYYCYQSTKTIGNSDKMIQADSCNNTLTQQCGDKPRTDSDVQIDRGSVACFCCAQEMQVIPMRKCMFYQVVSFCHVDTPAEKGSSGMPLWMKQSFTGLPACRYYLQNSCGGTFDKKSECMVCAGEAIRVGVCGAADVFAFCHAGMPTDYLCGAKSRHSFANKQGKAPYYAVMTSGKGTASGVEWQIDKGFKIPTSGDKVYLSHLSAGWHTLDMFGRTPSVGWDGATWVLKKEKDGTRVAGPFSLLKGGHTKATFMIHAVSKVHILKRPQPIDEAGAAKKKQTLEEAKQVWWGGVLKTGPDGLVSSSSGHRMV
jgi:hypothetical protein